MPILIDPKDLKNEILLDPKGIGYGAHITPGGTSSFPIADLMNAINPAIRIKRGVVPASEFVLEIDQAEYNILTDRKAMQWETLIAGGSINFDDPRAIAQFTSIFGVNSISKGNLTALAFRSGSRTEELFGARAVATRLDISKGLLS